MSTASTVGHHAPEVVIGTNKGQPECGDATRGVPVGVRRCAGEGSRGAASINPNKVVFSVGSEPTLFMRGILEGVGAAPTLVVR